MQCAHFRSSANSRLSLSSTREYKWFESAGVFNCGGFIFRRFSLCAHPPAFICNFLQRSIKYTGRWCQWGSCSSTPIRNWGGKRAEMLEVWAPSCLPLPLLNVTAPSDITVADKHTTGHRWIRGDKVDYQKRKKKKSHNIGLALFDISGLPVRLSQADMPIWPQRSSPLSASSFKFTPTVQTLLNSNTYKVLQQWKSNLPSVQAGFYLLHGNISPDYKAEGRQD